MRKITAFLAIVLVFTFGCSKKDEIKIATKPMTEQLIIGEMLSALISEHAGYKVKITHGVGGGTANIHPALLKGEFDLYPEYTGTGWSYVLKKQGIPDDALLFEELTGEYKDKYKLKWVGMYGFNNTFALALRKAVADRNGIETFSGLSSITPELVFGAEYDFYEREDGFYALCETYGYSFKQHIDLDIGLKYKAINGAQIDVMNIFTTDGQLVASDIVMLYDDKHFFPTYYCGTVVREDTLAKFPKLEGVLMMMQDILTESEMAQLNYAVETEKKDPKAVAIDFLKGKGLLK